jgi:hypothetical protein
MLLAALVAPGRASPLGTAQIVARRHGKGNHHYHDLPDYVIFAELQASESDHI